MDNLVNQLLDSGIFKPPDTSRYVSALFGTVTATPTTSVVSVLLDGDSVAVSMVSAVPCAANDRVITTLVGRTRVVTDNITDGCIQTYVSATRATAQSIPNNSATTVLYDTEVADALGEYDPTTGIFTAAHAGRRLVKATLLSASVAWDAGEIWCLSVYDGSADGYGFRWAAQTAHTGLASSIVAGVFDVAAGGTLRVRITQGQGGSINCYNSAAFNRLNIVRIR
jgi:hypothetical protein